MKVNIKKISRHATMPKQENGTSFTLYATDDFIANSNRVTQHRSGLEIKIPDLYYAFLLPTGETFMRGINVNGIIDETYVGEWIIDLQNITNSPIGFKRGDVIAQVVLTPKRTEFQLIEEKGV